MAVHRTKPGEDQLTLDVGGTLGKFVKAAFTLSGKVESYTAAIDREENVVVTVTDADGEVLFRSPGWVKAVQIETVPRKPGMPQHTLRKHTIKLGEEAPEQDEEE